MVILAIHFPDGVIAPARGWYVAESLLGVRSKAGWSAMDIHRIVASMTFNWMM
jgi:hypothetical protein